eukprot:565825-Prorocentrum_minimum.AAC.1
MVTPFYGSSCASYGKGAHDTPRRPRDGRVHGGADGRAVHPSGPPLTPLCPSSAPPLAPLSGVRAASCVRGERCCSYPSRDGPTTCASYHQPRGGSHSPYGHVL